MIPSSFPRNGGKREGVDIYLSSLDGALAVPEAVCQTISNSGTMLFPTTHWSALARATQHGGSDALSSLDQLCRAYWRPLNSFIRMRGFGPADADDLTQAFLVRLCERSVWRKAEAGKGRFRSFLLGALAHFLADERDRRSTQKRGGRVEHVSLESEGELTPALAAKDELWFDREWALSITEQVQAELAAEWAGRAQAFEVLQRYLPGAKELLPLEDGAAELGLSLSAMKSQLHRLRERFRELVRQRVAVTVAAPHEIEEELQHLGRVLMNPATLL